jgi:hypothetical protein
MIAQTKQMAEQPLDQNFRCYLPYDRILELVQEGVLEPVDPRWNIKESIRRRIAARLKPNPDSQIGPLDGWWFPYSENVSHQIEPDDDDLPPTEFPRVGSRRLLRCERPDIISKYELERLEATFLAGGPIDRVEDRWPPPELYWEWADAWNAQRSPFVQSLSDEEQQALVEAHCLEKTREWQQMQRSVELLR